MENHEKARRRVCLVCSGKGTLVIESGSKYERLINEFVIDGYWASERRLPRGLCHSCRKKLEQYSKGNFTSVLPECPDFSAMRSFRFRTEQAKSKDSGESPCPCVICQIFKACSTNRFATTGTKLKPGHHFTREVRNASQSATPKAISICMKCFGRIFQSVIHNCNAKAAVCNNQNIVPAILMQTAATRVLTDLTGTDGKAILSTGGRKVAYRKVSPVSTSSPKQTIVPATAISEMAQTADLSQNQAMKLVKVLRKSVDIEPNIRQHLSKINKKYADFFVVERIESNEESFPLAFCRDIRAFLNAIVSARSVEYNEIVYRLSIDEGRGHLKISGSLIFKDSTLEIRGAKSTSVRMMHLLALSPMKESYCSIRTMIEKLRFQDIPSDLEYFFAQDLKCFNIALGLGNHRIPRVESWPKSLHLVRENYQGRTFEGNECRTLLKNLHGLRIVLKNCNKEDVGRPFVDVLDSFNSIVTIVHEEEVNLNELKSNITSFRAHWKSSGMNLTPKAHIVICHLYDFVLSKNGKNISIFSEQAHESLHAKFEHTWNKYLVKDVASEAYLSRLLRAMLDFNGNYGN